MLRRSHTCLWQPPLFCPLTWHQKGEKNMEKRTQEVACLHNGTAHCTMYTIFCHPHNIPPIAFLFSSPHAQDCNNGRGEGRGGGGGGGMRKGEERVRGSRGDSCYTHPLSIREKVGAASAISICSPSTTVDLSYVAK